MKKVTIFPILLIVSITAFAQDKSPNSERFSLIQHSEDNNRNFFNFSGLSHTNLLFYEEKKDHSRQNQDIQILGFHLASEQIHISRISPFENRKQNWQDMFNPVYEQQEDGSSEETSVSLAEVHLKRLAERTKKGRKIAGPILIVLGGVCAGLGASIVSGAEEEDLIGSVVRGMARTQYFIEAAVLIGGGIYALAVSSPAERKLKEVLKLSNPAARERASHEALSSLAVRARKWRIISGITEAAFAVAFLVDDPEKGLPFALISGGIAIYEFVWKTPEEKAYQNYLNEREQQKELRLLIGVGHHGGVKIGFALSF